jgi:hypothetical protein
MKYAGTMCRWSAAAALDRNCFLTLMNSRRRLCFVVSYGHQLGTGQLVNAKPPKGHVVFSSVGEVLVLSSPTHKPYLFFWSNFSQVYLIRELITS